MDNLSELAAQIFADAFDIHHGQKDPDITYDEVNILEKKTPIPSFADSKSQIVVCLLDLFPIVNSHMSTYWTIQMALYSAQSDNMAALRRFGSNVEHCGEDANFVNPNTFDMALANQHPELRQIVELTMSIFFRVFGDFGRPVVRQKSTSDVKFAFDLWPEITNIVPELNTLLSNADQRRHVSQLPLGDPFWKELNQKLTNPKLKELLDDYKLLSQKSSLFAPCDQLLK